MYFFLLRVTHLLPGWASNPIGHGLRRGLCGAGGARLFFGCLARFFFAVGAPLPGAGPVRRNPMGRGPASRGARLFFCCGCAARFFFCCGCAAGSLTHLLPGWASGIQLAMVAVGACAGPGGGRVYFFAAGARRGFFFAVGARQARSLTCCRGGPRESNWAWSPYRGLCGAGGGGGGRVYFFAAGARQLWGGAFIFLLRVRVAFIFLLRVRELTHSLTRCPESTNSKKAHTQKKKHGFQTRRPAQPNTNPQAPPRVGDQKSGRRGRKMSQTRPQAKAPRLTGGGAKRAQARDHKCQAADQAKATLAAAEGDEGRRSQICLCVIEMGKMGATVE